MGPGLPSFPSSLPFPSFRSPSSGHVSLEQAGRALPSCLPSGPVPGQQLKSTGSESDLPKAGLELRSVPPKGC
ncbi:hypothetical protein JRQ81_017726 [Phrynocephalus forsythii]|uniref:Uncharacterized protein n=1 Tax=Phrynocephalus forsythii TaxID=171643 RepID=A0A9Q0XQX1_9SAUR|nr:hypothetical protein JRQ81_017726 [Phrynocephalus forsythii]